jgi:Protein of unknown function (DUF3632)
LSSFAARLTKNAFVEAYYFAGYEIRRVLEEEGENPREVVNYNVSVASEWILQCGLQFFEEIRNIESLG